MCWYVLVEMQPGVLLGSSKWVTWFHQLGTHISLSINPCVSQAEAALEHSWIVRKAEKASGCWSGMRTAKCGEVMKNQQIQWGFPEIGVPLVIIHF